MEVSVQTRQMLLFALWAKTTHFLPFPFSKASCVRISRACIKCWDSFQNATVISCSLSWDNCSVINPDERTYKSSGKAKCPQIRELWRMCLGIKWRTFNLSRLFHLKKKKKRPGGKRVLHEECWSSSAQEQMGSAHVRWYNDLIIPVLAFLTYLLACYLLLLKLLFLTRCCETRAYLPWSWGHWCLW